MKDRAKTKNSRNWRKKSRRLTEQSMRIFQTILVKILCEHSRCIPVLWYHVGDTIKQMQSFGWPFHYFCLGYTVPTTLVLVFVILVVEFISYVHNIVFVISIGLIFCKQFTIFSVNILSWGVAQVFALVHD